MSQPPLVSCLCVTENRAAFMPWLLWSFGRQTHGERELVIVDSSKQPLELEGRGVRVVRAAHGTNVPAKRNLALSEASGSIIAWFDDDDWQHPERLARLVEAISGGAVFAGPSTSYFVDLHGPRCARYAGGSSIIFNGSGFSADAARQVRFDERRLRGSDSVWLRALTRRRASDKQVLSGVLSMWLCHDANISNPRRRRRFRAHLEEARNAVGDAAWADTGEQLERLRERLATSSPRCVAVAVPVRPTKNLPSEGKDEPPSDRASVSVATPPLAPRPSEARPGVSVVVKVTALDGAFAGRLIPHMIAQAKFPFAERVVVVDAPRAFTGKYARRRCVSADDLDETLSKLMSDGVVDRVVSVDYDGDRIRETMRAYFGESGVRAPTHGVPGCPIYATLFAMEAVNTDLLVQLDSDMLFHASGESWVEHGVGILAGDPSAWLVMTQAGPPSGTLGTRASLGPANARRATWDARMKCWRFRTASTRYFLTDRRRLRGMLPLLRHAGGVAPLEQCISRALQRHGAYRANLAVPGSWDLHAYHHGAPFLDWAPRLVEAVEQGRFPAMQAGNYDLRLDSHASVEAWRNLLDGPTTRPTSPPSRPTGGSTATRPVVEHATAPCPISVVIPIRDRAGARVDNALASLAWQTAGRPAEIVVASHGSQPEIDADLHRLCDRHNARFLQLADPSAPWCKPFALNSAIRATNPDVPFIMTMDADMILAPNFLGAVLQVLRNHEKVLVLCRSSDLRSEVKLPPNPEALEQRLPALRRGARLRGRHGCGGIQAAHRSLFFELRGYDEELVWWGAEDGDLLKRSTAAGYRTEWIEGRAFMLHQWHPKRHAALQTGTARQQAASAWSRNHSLVHSRQGVIRNPESWGGAP